MFNILIAIGIFGGLGAFFGVILAIASKAFAVEVDPRVELLMEVLPGANCGACGHSGCTGYAAAIAKGEAAIGLCPVGGMETAERIANIMGIARVGSMARQVALVRCTGDGRGKEQYLYDGIQDCFVASRISGGGAPACHYGCLGFGTCVRACPFGAISMGEKAAVVDEEKCKGCLKCVSACPRNLITVIPYDSDISILCSSRDGGKDVRAVCDEGCIGCGLCVKSCPKGAIRMENHLARIDYSKCVACGKCVSACPRGLIRVSKKEKFMA